MYNVYAVIPIEQNEIWSTSYRLGKKLIQEEKSTSTTNENLQYTKIKRKMKRAGRKESKQAKTRAEEEEEDEYDGWRRGKKAFISSFGSIFSHQNWLNYVWFSKFTILPLI